MLELVLGPVFKPVLGACAGGRIFVSSVMQFPWYVYFADVAFQDTWPVFDDMFHSSAESTALIPMRRSLMTLAAKAGPQRFDDIKMASNAYPVCLKEEGQTWYIEMLRQNLYEGRGHGVGNECGL